MQIKRLPRSVTRELRYYVYLYIDPEDGEVFYVGKGKGNRALSHADGTGDEKHAEFIRNLRRKGLRPEVEILIHGLATEEAAHAVEAAVIDLIGVENLTNESRGHGSSKRGRMTLEQVLALYQRKRAKITEPTILIRINELYRYGMTDMELYDATRGVWVVGERREKAELAMAVYEGIVREVYEINHWLPGGSTFSTRDPRGVQHKGRWEFVGTLAPKATRQKYLHRAVDKYLTRGSRNPITYVNCNCD